MSYAMAGWLVTVPATDMTSAIYGIETVEDEYVNSRNLEQIGRPEDLYVVSSAATGSRICCQRFFRSTRDAFILDGEEQLLLGGDNGLRGCPLRFQADTISTLATLEQRFCTHWQPLKLFNVGAAAFTDVGRTWGHDNFAAPPSGWLSEIGVGLRLGAALGSRQHSAH